MLRIHATLGVFVAFALLAAPTHAQNRLYLDPVLEVPDTSGPVSLDLLMDFSDSTSGGGIEVGYDAAVLMLTGIVFDAGLPDDSDFRCPGSTVVLCPGNPGFLSIGNFGGLSGQFRVASLAFDVIGAGDAAVSITIVNAFDDGTGSPLDVTVDPGSIFVVPEPGVAVALAAGALALCVLSRKRAVLLNSGRSVRSTLT